MGGAHERVVDRVHEEEGETAVGAADDEVANIGADVAEVEKPGRAGRESRLYAHEWGAQRGRGGCDSIPGMLLESGLREALAKRGSIALVTPYSSAAPLAALLLCLSLLASAAPAPADPVDAAAQLYREGNRTAAIERIERFLLDNPKDPRGRFLRAQLLADKGDNEGAIELYTGIISEYPELAEPYNNLAVIYAKQGRYELARNYLEQAVQAFPEYSVAFENLGDVYAKLAESSYRSAAQYDKTSSGLKSKISTLTQMLPDQAPAPVFRTPLPPKPVAARKKKGGAPAPASPPPLSPVN